MEKLPLEILAIIVSYSDDYDRLMLFFTNRNLMKLIIRGEFRINKNKICSYAAGYGNLEVLKWSRKNKCPWGFRTCFSAALMGHLEVLKWLRERMSLE